MEFRLRNLEALWEMAFISLISLARQADMPIITQLELLPSKKIIVKLLKLNWMIYLMELDFYYCAKLQLGRSNKSRQMSIMNSSRNETINYWKDSTASSLWGNSVQMRKLILFFRMAQLHLSVQLLTITKCLLLNSKIQKIKRTWQKNLPKEFLNKK